MICCTCKKFEECGYLCYHALRILHIHSVTEIPQRYVKRRWQKYVKQAIWDTHNAASEKSTMVAPWRQQLMRTYYNVLIKGQHNEQARLAIEDATKTIASVVDGLVTGLQAITTSDTVQLSESSMSVLNPSHSNTKGRKNKRIKGHQKSKKAKEKSSDASVSTEFGTKTPIPRLL